MRRRAVVVVLALLFAVAGSPAGAQPGGGTVSGTVTGPDGEALEGVCIEVYDDEYRTAQTGADGRYRIDDVAGEVLVAFNSCPEPLPGYAIEFYDDTAGFSDADYVVVQEGQQVTGVDAALEEAAAISGTVTDEGTGEGLDRSCVFAIELEDGPFAFTQTAADGTYALANLRGGEYLVGFADCSDPFNHVRELYDDTPLDLPIDLGLETEPTTVTVEDGEEATGVDAALTEGGSAVGTVTARHTGRPADLVCVALFEPEDAPDSPAAVSVTGFRPDGAAAPGTFVVAGVRPGDYVVGFNAEQVCGDDGYVAQWADGNASHEDADVTTVRQGEVTAGLDAVLAPRPSISFACPYGPEPRFRDVSRDSVHAPAISCLDERGVVSGRPDGSYGPAEPVRREQMATFVAGTLRALDVELPASPPDAFRDDDRSVHARAIDQLAALGVVSGKPDGRFAPAETVSRGQMTAFLVRAYEAATGVPLLAPDDAYTDDDGTTHEPSIDRATTAGLAAGTGSGTFDPGGDVRRDQMATFVARLVDRVLRDTGGSAFFTTTTTVSSESAEPAPMGSMARLLQQAAAARG
jgi:hypothetical protein